MNKKSMMMLLALLMLAAALLLGLPYTTDRIIADRMDQTVAETATPLPTYAEDEQ